MRVDPELVKTYYRNNYKVYHTLIIIWLYRVMSVKLYLSRKTKDKIVVIKFLPAIFVSE